MYSLLTLLSKSESVPYRQMEQVLDTWKSKQQCGLIFQVDGDSYQVRLFAGGDFITTYEKRPGQIKKFSGTDFEPLSESATGGNFFFSPCQPLGILISRVVLEQEPVLTESIPQAALKALIDRLRNDKTPTLLDVQWNDSCGTFVIPGSGKAVVDAVYYDRTRGITGNDALSLILNHAGAECQVSHYPALETDAWIEYSLRHLFDWSAWQLMSRYGELTGRIMVTNIVRDLNVNCAAMNIDIAAYASHIENNALFPSVLSAVEHYRFLFNLIIHHMEVVVGSGLVVMIVRQVSEGLSPYYSELLSRYELFQNYYVEKTSSARLK